MGIVRPSSRAAFQSWIGALLSLIFALNLCLADTLRVGLDQWPPFSGKNLPDLGLSADIISTVFKEAGYRTEISILPWSRVENYLKSGDLDVMGNLYHVEDIAKWADNSAPYFQSKIKFVALRERHIRWNTLTDLAPYEIGVGFGYSFGEPFDHASGLKKRSIPLTANGLQMLLLGRLDLVIDSEEVILYHLQHELAGDAQRFEILEPALVVQPISIGVSKNNPRAKQIIGNFNTAFAKLSKDGTIKAIVERHLQSP